MEEPASIEKKRPRPNIPLRVRDWELHLNPTLRDIPQQPTKGLHLKGKVIDANDGKERTIVTSRIMQRYDEIVISESGTYYSLAKPSERYQQLVPKAKELFLAALEDITGTPGAKPPTEMIPTEAVSSQLRKKQQSLPDSF